MSIALPFIYICGLTLLFSNIFKRSFGSVAPMAMMAAILTLFLSGMFGDLRYGLYITYVASCCGYIMSVFNLLTKKEKLSDILKRFMSPAFFCFVIFYAVIIIINRNRVIWLWDEISHWASMAKEMCRLNRFYSDSASMLASHSDYPPAMTLFQYIFCKVSGGYREGFLYRAQNLFTLMLFLPAADCIKDGTFLSKATKAFLCSALIIFANTLISNNNNFYNALYVDDALGLIFAYCIICGLLKDKSSLFGLLRLSLGLCILILTKQFALVMYALAIFILLCDALLFKRDHIAILNKKAETKDRFKNAAEIIVFTVVIPLAAYFLWNINIRLANAGSQFNTTSIDLFGGIRALFGYDDGTYRLQVVKNFISEVFSGVLVSKPIPVSCFSLMIIISLLIGALAYYGKGTEKKGRLAVLSATVFISGLGFSYAMMLTWMYSFGEVAGLTLISFERYMTTFWFGGFALVTMLFIYVNEKKNQAKPKRAFVILALITAAVIALSIAGGRYDLTKKADYSADSLVNFSGDTDTIRNNTLPEERIYIITQQNDDYEMFVFRYLLMPQYSNTDGYNLGAFTYNSADNTSEATPPDKFIERLSEGKYDYVYVYKTDDYLLENYYGVFAENAQPEEKALYKINYEDGKITGFTKVN